MKFFKDNKSVITLGVIVILVLFGYSLLPAPDMESGTTSATNVGDDLVKISNSLSQANLNRDLFSQSGYRLLSDFTLPLTPEPVGRSNPFAPIGQ